MQHLQEPAIASGSAPSDLADRVLRARFRRKALTGPIDLEAHFSPATAPQAEILDDAVRLLAIWAVRAARAGQSAVPEAAPVPADSTCMDPRF